MHPEVELLGLAALEAFAVDLARVAGEEIQESLGREIEVSYKDLTGPLAPTDAVTDVDHHIEEVLVARIREAFPGHGILGEEGTRHFPEGFEYSWMIDPIDGTQNFVNGLPFYSSSVGLLWHGRPVAGAIWGASTHRLGAGVYHARSGEPLYFNSIPLDVARPARGRVRGLGAMPHDEDQHLHPGATEPQGRYRLPWDRRHVGSGALEAAFVAAGIFVTAELAGPAVGDSVPVHVRVQGPPWASVDRLRVYAGREATVDRAIAAGADEVVDVPLRGASFVVVRVDGGPAPTPIQHFEPMGVTHPLWL